LALAIAGGSVLVLSGCDPTARDTVLSGVEGATTTLFGTFIRAFFETLQMPDTTATTVRAVFDHAQTMFC